MFAADALLALFGKSGADDNSEEYLGALLLAEHLHIVRSLAAPAKK
jgi:hypothetical protein